MTHDSAVSEASGRIMPEAVIFVGVQGAGKSTFYQQRFFDTHVRINLDMLRTRHREQLLFTACLEAGQSFVVDNTNLMGSDRARYIGAAKTAAFQVLAYYFPVPLRDALARNNQRQGRQKIPVPAIAGALKKLQPPTMEEGFDRIYTVDVKSEEQFEITPAR